MDGLNDTQRYFVEEHIEDFRDGLIVRRELIRRVAIVVGSAATAVTLGVALIPAMQSKRSVAISSMNALSMREPGRGIRSDTRGVLVVVEVAITLILLVASAWDCGMLSCAARRLARRGRFRTSSWRHQLRHRRSPPRDLRTRWRFFTPRARPPGQKVV